MSTNKFDPAWQHGHLTRNGRKARIICMNAKGTHPIVALVTGKDGSETPAGFTSAGQFYKDERSESDLINAPEQPKERFAFVYHDDESTHETLESALREKSEFCQHSGVVVKFKLVGGKPVSAEIVEAP